MSDRRLSHRELLQQIARRAMIDYSLEPDFPREVAVELERLSPPR